MRKNANVIPIGAAAVEMHAPRGQAEPERAPHTEPCARCGQAVEVSPWLWEILIHASSALEGRGDVGIGEGERVLCPSCERAHRARQDAERALHDEADRVLWRRYVAGDVSEAELLGRVTDRARYRRRLREHRQSTAKTTKRGRQRLKDAGF